MTYGVSVLFSIAVCIFAQYECEIICFSCTGLSEGEKCHNAISCAENEICFTQKYRTKDNITKYDVGCSYPELCRKDSTGVIFGKRMVDHGHVVCHQCCQDNVCNSILTCNDNYKVPSLSCLSCSGVMSTDQCNTTIACTKNEVCFTQKYRTTLNQEYYDLGCKSSTICMNGFFLTYLVEVQTVRDIFCVNLAVGEVLTAIATSYVVTIIVRKTHNSTCTMSDECIETLFCIHGACKCDRIDYWMGNKCSARKEAKSNCTETEECKDTLHCVDDKCVCNEGDDWFWNGRICRHRNTLGHFCLSHNDCEASLICNGNTCICNNTELGNGVSCSVSRPMECYDIPFKANGVYVIYPTDRIHPKPVYCVLQDGINWTVIQRRFNGSVNFTRNWTSYKNGFGDVNGEYWLGNEYIHLISSNGRHKIRFQLWKADGTKKYADYSTFSIGNEANKYLLTVNGYSGTAGDNLIYAGGNGDQGIAAGKKFSTFDSDNDLASRNCAALQHGGWWYSDCEFADINQLYSSMHWRFNMGILKKSIMMISRGT